MPATVEDIVDYIMAQDHVNLKDAVGEVLATKASDAVDSRKAELGYLVFGNNADEDDEVELDDEIDDTEEEEDEDDDLDLDDDDDDYNEEDDD